MKEIYKNINNEQFYFVYNLLKNNSLAYIIGNGER